MVKFDKGNHAFTVTVTGDKDHYCNSLKALTRAMTCMEQQALDKETIFHIGTLLEEMLPDSNQIIDRNDA